MKVRVGSLGGWLVLLGLSLLVWPASASPVKNPRRVVGERVVDISPLLHWWTNRDGVRPLTAWVHVTGTIVGTNSYGWLVEAAVENSRSTTREAGPSGGQKRILLRHPPLQDRAAFEGMAAELKRLTDQRAEASSMQTQANNFIHPWSNNAVRPHFAMKTLDLREARATEQNAAAQGKQLDQQIKELKTKMSALWSNTASYEVDCFALDTGRDLDRVPLYEHGAAWQ